MNKKIIEQNNNIRLLSNENTNLQKYNKDILNDNKILNEKINQLLKEITQKENNFNLKIYDASSKMEEIDKENKNILENFQNLNQEKEKISINFEKFCNFVNQKLQELYDFLIQAYNSNDLLKLSDEIEYNKNNVQINDIKYELVENTIVEMKKNILKYILNIKEKNSHYINEYNNILRDKDILETQNNEMINELNMYKQNQNDIENNNQEITSNYEQLKQTYTKLYNDYSLFTDTNTKYVKETQIFYMDLIERIKNLFGDKTIIDNEKGLNQILNEYVNILIDKYNLLLKKIEENKKNEEMTCKKMFELSNLLEESQNYMKKYEFENRKLREENEKINYRYCMLKASVDIIEKDDKYKS